MATAVLDRVDPPQYAYSDEEAMSDISSIPEKDEAEEELEQLVFGDSAGFRDQLRAYADKVDESKALVTATTAGLEDVQDAELFFTDLGDADNVPLDLITGPAVDETDSASFLHPAAWEDSDDERLTVSLAAVPRLRKLRRTEDEDVINGREYSKRLRRQYELLNPRPQWAASGAQRKTRRRVDRGSGSEDEEDVSMSDDDDDTDVQSTQPLAALLRQSNGLVAQSRTTTGKRRKLRPESIEIQRVKDIPGVQPSSITSLAFHPKYPLLLSSGPAATLYLHHIAPSPPAPEANPLLTSLHIRKTALTTTAFHPIDSRIFLSARRRYFHVWDLQTGQVEKVTRVYGQQHEQRTMERFKLSPDGTCMALLGSSRKGGGVINILSASTLQWMSQVRVESRGGIAEFAWWRNGKGLTIAGKSGEITEWSVAEERVVARWQDEGAVGTTTIALGGQHEFVKSAIGQDRWLAIGSSSGIVNVYDRRAWLASGQMEDGQPIPLRPKPTKVLDHLTTPTSNLVFSPDGQILVMSSKWKRDALRFVHLPTCTVYKNWPTSSTAFGRITAVAFCAGDQLEGDIYALLAVANEQGKIRLWELR